MKAVILAGGLGTRLSEETDTRPKPMVEIGGKPILWHIMKIFAHHGVADFVVCAGFKGEVIKDYFLRYAEHAGDFTVALASGKVTMHRRAVEDWRVTIVDTGRETQTAGRLKRVREHVAGEDAFFMTYGDGVADVDLKALLAQHRRDGRLATVTAVRPPGRFGALGLDGTRVAEFVEKPLGDGGLINGGFFALSPKALDGIAGDAAVWESDSLPALARAGQLGAYIHRGYWQAMDTLRDKRVLEQAWAAGKAPWKTWNDA